MEIDLVYLWVDGNDPNWLAKKNSFTSIKSETKGRYQDNQELKYALRSVDKHLPWIRTIFILTDNQVPAFLDVDHPKIKIIDHTEVMSEEMLPNFNSSVIEHFIYKIPGLSEHYLYSNDDMFVNADLAPSFFFDEGRPIMRMLYDPFARISLFLKRLFKIKINLYGIAVENSFKLFKKRFNLFYPIKQHHNIDAYLKSDYKKVVEGVFKNEIEPMFMNRFRHRSDIHRILINYYAIANKKAILKYVKRKESCRIRVHRTNYEKYIRKYDPQLFCLNDTEHATDAHRACVEPFLKQLYPEKASFEK